MPTETFFENKTTHKRYKILAIDKSVTPPMLTLQGEVATFTQPLDVPLFKQLGYDLVQVEVKDVRGP